MTKKDKRLNRFKKIIKTSALIIAIGIMSLLYFLTTAEPPILKGEVEYGIEYKPELELDVYFPTHRIYEKSPVVLFLHGGAWVTGRKESLNLKRLNGAINGLRENGYTIVAPEYTLAREGKSPFPDCIVDSYDVVQWIVEHADSLQLDLGTFGIMGESAGGHIALMTAYAKPQDFGLGYQKVSFDWIVDVYGPTDLTSLYQSQTVDSLNAVLAELPSLIREPLDLPKLLYGFDPRIDSVKRIEMSKKYSPISYLTPDAPPILIVHGTEDIVVPIEQTILLKEMYDSLGISNEVLILDGVHHGFFFASDEQKESVQKTIPKFVLAMKQLQ